MASSSPWLSGWWKRLGRHSWVLDQFTKWLPSSSSRMPSAAVPRRSSSASVTASGTSGWWLKSCRSAYAAKAPARAAPEKGYSKVQGLKTLKDTQVWVHATHGWRTALAHFCSSNAEP